MTKPQLRLVETTLVSICAECKHVRDTRWWDGEIRDRVFWTCKHNNGTDPVTGGPVSIDCQRKNPSGKCQDFDRYEPPPPRQRTPWWLPILKWLTR